MKKYIIIFVALLTQFCILSSCDDYLDLKPTDGVPRQDYWKTKEDVASFTTGLYSSMLNGDMVTRMFLWGESRADMIQSGNRKIDANIQRIIEGEISSDNKYCSWAPFYKTINQCNTLLKYAPDAQANDPSFSQKALKEYQAQAVAIRTLMYFYLVRTFGDVPFPLEAYVDNSQKMSMPKVNQTVILDSLVAQLGRVEANIPYSYGTDAAQNKGRITRYAADALLADIYLWKEDYESCVKMCDKVILSGQYALVPVSRSMEVTTGATVEENDTVYHPSASSVASLYNKVYAEGNSIESIFELQFETDILNPFYSMMTQTVATVMAKTDVLSEEIYIPTSKDDNSYYDIRSNLASKNGYIWKYVGKELDGSTFRAETEMTANWIIYRLSDVLLMKAEALTQIGIKSGEQSYLKEARACIEKVRVRANAVESTDLTYGQTDYDGKTLENFVLQERAREFAFEGKRWFDVLRQAKRDNYAGTNLDYLTKLAVYSAPADKVFSLQTKYKNHKSHYLPISKSELETNPALVQNEFYGENK
jgi:hypothetical protein